MQQKYPQVFNVSGTYFMIETDIFSRYPDTLLGSDRLEEFYRPSRDEYFLEHNKYIFPAVLRFYTHQEELVCPPCMPKDTFEVRSGFRTEIIRAGRSKWSLLGASA